jgi:hypothetical protein
MSALQAVGRQEQQQQEQKQHACQTGITVPVSCRTVMCAFLVQKQRSWRWGSVCFFVVAGDERQVKRVLL